MFMRFRAVIGEGSCLFAAVVLSLHYETNQGDLKSKVLTNEAVQLRYEALQFVINNFDALNDVDIFAALSVPLDEKDDFLAKMLVWLEISRAF